MASALASAAMVVGAIGGAQPTYASSVLPDTLYGVASFPDLGSTHVVRMDMSEGITPLAEPGYFEDLAFDSSGRLFATTTCPGSLGGDLSCGFSAPSVLVELDPVTGALVSTIGTVTDASGTRPIIESLTAQPGSDWLYGIGGLGLGDPSPGIWTIDKATAVATRLPAPALGTGLAFGPDGTLYHSAGALTGGPGGIRILDPDTGAPIGSLTTSGGGFRALAVRSDGTLFATVVIRVPPPCRTCPAPLIVLLLAIDPSTGEMIDPSTGQISSAEPISLQRVGTALDISPAAIPEPSTALLVAAGLIFLALRGRPVGFR